LQDHILKQICVCENEELKTKYKRHEERKNRGAKNKEKRGTNYQMQILSENFLGVAMEYRYG